MKKIYSFMLALFATLCVGTAHAASISFKVNVDNPEAVTLEADWKEVSLGAGDNVITVTEQGSGEYAYYNAVYLYLNEGFGIQNITSSSEDVGTFTKQGAGVYALYPDNKCADITYTVTTFAYDDKRSDSAIVIMDDINAATMRYGNGQGILLTRDTTVVYFSSDKNVGDLPMYLRPENQLYSVKVAGTPVEATWSGYALEPANGDTIVVLANAPAGLTFPLIFQWADDADKASLDSLQVDGVKIDYKDTVEVAWGKEVKMWFNAAEYLVKVNNEAIADNKGYNYYSQNITDTTIWEITSAKYENFDVKIIAHNASCISIQKSADYSYVELQDGENTVSLNTKNTTLWIKKATDCVIDSVKVNGEIKASFSAVQCKKDMVIEIWGDSVRRDMTFAFYVDDMKKYQSYSIRTNDYKYLAYYYNGPYLESGYTKFAFGKVDNPISFSMSLVENGKKPVYYVNDSIVTPNWDGYKLTLANNDVVKVFADTAEVFEVNMFVEDGVDVTDITKDRIVPIVDWTNPVSVLQNTEISFKTNAEKVKVNGEEVSGEAGVFTLVIEKNTIILVGNAEPTGMENAVIGNKAEKFVRDGQLIIRMNGVEYNVLGAKLQ